MQYKQANVLHGGGESIWNCGFESWAVGYRLKKDLFSREIDFGRRPATAYGILRVRNEVIREKWG